MASTRILKKWIALTRRKRVTRGNDFLLSRTHFQAALRRERLRSDRTLVALSMLTLTFNRNTSPQAMETACKVLATRVRETDVAGWLADRTIGIVLPDTPASGAWTLAEDLRRLLGLRELNPKLTVYVYPSFDSQDGELVADDGSAAVDPDAAPSLPVQPLSVLFVQKLPPWKRGLDIVGASVGLLLAAPLLLLAAIAVKVSSRGPVMFVQKRHGLGAREFKIYKFRTMIVNAEELKAQLRAISEQDGPAFKLARDPRVTRIGNFLRKTSIDELPQLFNVLRGEMSLVGPRPLPCDESAACQPWQKARLSVTPGLTCIWQVHGRSRVSFDEWMRMDLEYARSRSPWRDVKLLCQTVFAVLLRRGAC